MSATIPIRTAGGQVLQVPPLRLSWTTKHPRLIELMDTVKEMQLGTWEGTEANRIALMAEFLGEVVRASGYVGPELEADAGDVVAIHGALRGCAPDPTRASAEG